MVAVLGEVVGLITAVQRVIEVIKLVVPVEAVR